MTKPTGRPNGRPPRPLRPHQFVKRGRLTFRPLYRELCARQIVTARQIADFYGVDKFAVSRWCRQGVGTFTADRLAIRLGLLPVVIWGDAFFAPELLEYELANAGERREFTPSKVRSLRSRHAAGERIADLAREFGCGPMAVSNVVKRRSYADVT